MKGKILFKFGVESQSSAVSFIPLDSSSDERIVNGIHQVRIYSEPVYVPDKNGEWQNISEILTFSVDNSLNINVSRDNGEYITGQVFANYNGNNVSLSSLRDLESNYGARISKTNYVSKWKYALETTRIPSGLNYIFIRWDRSHSTTIVENYNDLISNNFTVSMQGRDVIISDFSRNLVNSSLFDPIVKLGNETGGQSTLNDTFACTGCGLPEGNITNGDKVYMETRDHPSGQSADARMYIKQNFSSITGNIDISNATFYLTEDDGFASDTGVINIYNVSDQGAVDGFSEYKTFGNISWYNQPCGPSDTFNSSCNSTLQTTFTISNNQGTYGINIINIVNSVEDSTKAFVLVSTAADNGFEKRVESKDSTISADKKPYLYLEYTNSSPPSPPEFREFTFIWNNNTQSIFVNNSFRSLFLNVSTINSTDINGTNIRATTLFEAGVSLANSYLLLSGGTLTGTLISQTIRPSSNLLYDLGSSSFRWLNVFSQNVNATNYLNATRIFENGNRFPQPTTCSGTNKIAIFNSDGTFTCATDQSGNTISTTLCSTTNCTVIGLSSGYNVTVFAKGIYTGSASPQNITLYQNTTAADENAVDLQQASDTDSFALIYYTTISGTDDITYKVNNTGGTISNVKILIQVAR